MKILRKIDKVVPRSKFTEKSRAGSLTSTSSHRQSRAAVDLLIFVHSSCVCARVARSSDVRASRQSRRARFGRRFYETRYFTLRPRQCRMAASNAQGTR
ncbi:hypothetical protein EVAR_36572_1 [Eumeta japonica]|uniref:Uncharacterized protein n=1 Tax=Eumeta variegata TaxID=151549 RepID=A0A4C1XZZ2_EUMVA|nr:hypothetical protein EVAR_36572_1 [Eumeta japonica]